MIDQTWRLALSDAMSLHQAAPGLLRLDDDAEHMHRAAA